MVSPLVGAAAEEPPVGAPASAEPAWPAVEVVALGAAAAASVVSVAPGGAEPADAAALVVAAADAESARAEAWELESAPSLAQPVQGTFAVEPEPAEPVSPVWGAGEVRLWASLRKKKEKRLVAPARAFAD